MEVVERQRRVLRRVRWTYLRYLAVHVFLSPLLAVRGLSRASRRGYAGITLQRLLGGSRPPHAAPWVVIVAGGLGETRVALKAATEFQAKFGVPTAVLVQSTNALALSAPDVFSGVLPFNNPLSVWLMLRRWRPRSLWCVEFWDNHHLKAMAAAQGIPMVLFNVPITEGATEEEGRVSANRWRWQIIGRISVQAAIHQERLLQIGVSPEAVSIDGPLALGLAPRRESDEAVGSRWRDLLGLDGAHPIVLAGSTHLADEEAVMAAFGELRRSFPAAVLILAPRHLDRVDDVATVASARRRSEGRGEMPASRTIVIDTHGELNELYLVADLAVVGGTFDPQVGGHTPIEALAAGVPITAGPFFAQQAGLFEALVERSLLRVAQDANQLLEHWNHQLAADPVAYARAASTFIAEGEDRSARLFREIHPPPGT